MWNCNKHGVLPTKLNYTALVLKHVVFFPRTVMDAVSMTTDYAVQMDLALVLQGSVEFVCYI